MEISEEKNETEEVNNKELQKPKTTLTYNCHNGGLSFIVLMVNMDILNSMLLI